MQVRQYAGVDEMLGRIADDVKLDWYLQKTAGRNMDPESANAWQ